MTLRCECGGAVKIVDSSYNEDTAFERYECPSCGQTGTYSFGPSGDSTSGCVVSDRRAEP